MEIINIQSSTEAINTLSINPHIFPWCEIVETVNKVMMLNIAENKPNGSAYRTTLLNLSSFLNLSEITSAPNPPPKKAKSAVIWE